VLGAVVATAEGLQVVAVRGAGRPGLSVVQVAAAGIARATWEHAPTVPGLHEASQPARDAVVRGTQVAELDGPIDKLPHSLRHGLRDGLFVLLGSLVGVEGCRKSS